MLSRPSYVGLVVAFTLAGCTHRFDVAHQTQTFEADSVASNPLLINNPVQNQPYLLDTGDRIRVFIYGQPNLSRIYLIDGTGHISMPLAGGIRAREKSTRALEDIVASRLQAEFIKDPHVSIEIATYRPFFILGEVRNSGQFPFVEGMTARTAVAIAGGYAPRADEGKVQITREMQDHSQTFYAEADESVRPGDTIYIPERWF